MAGLRERIQEAYTTAMKARAEAPVRTLRLLLSDLKRMEVDERRAVTEAELLALLHKSIKRRKEAIEAAAGQGRHDIVACETEEMVVLQRFLPEPLGPCELEALVAEAIRETGATSRREQGRVMQVLMPRVAGRADGQVVARLVSERLA
jgi:uncharacterized protein YqeY